MQDIDIPTNGSGKVTFHMQRVVLASTYTQQLIQNSKTIAEMQ